VATEAIAKKAFAGARKIYEGGSKSSNKSYDSDAVPWYKKVGEKLFDTVTKRNAKTARADATLGLTRTSEGYQGTAGNWNSRIQKGQILVNAGCPAANCDELTNIAAHLATQEGAPGAELFAGCLTDPADHVFCVYGLFADVILMDGKRVRDLVNFPGIGKLIYAIDPWANLVCKLHEYPKLASEKMKKWAKDGKRVWWGHGPRGAGTYPPAGVDGYSKAFLDAPLELSYANR
jgi:hypothetical protein